MRIAMVVVVLMFAASSAFAQEAKTVCRPKPAGNVYIEKGEAIVGRGDDAQICHLETSMTVQEERKFEPASSFFEPKPITSKCLIVEIAKVGPLHHGDPARLYRESFNVPQKEIRARYSEGQLTKLMRKDNVHVIVLDPGQEVNREACR